MSSMTVAKLFAVESESEDDEKGFDGMTPVEIQVAREKRQKQELVRDEAQKAELEKNREKKKRKEMLTYLRSMAEDDPVAAEKLKAEEDKAATYIQARVRGCQARMRAIAAKERQKTKRHQDKSATKIQASYRGKSIRSTFKETLAITPGKAPGISRRKLIILKKIFDRLDRDGSGDVSKAEFIAASRVYGEYENLFDGIDDDENGKITWEEFQEFYTRGRAFNDVEYTRAQIKGATTIQATARGISARKQYAFFKEFGLDDDAEGF